MQTVPDFFNKVKTELMSTYFPTVVYYRDNKQSEKMCYALELFNNGCSTYGKLIKEVAKQTKATEENIQTIIDKYIQK